MAEKKTYQSIVCVFFKNGYCHLGSNCRFRHVESTRHEPRANIAEMPSLSPRPVTFPSLLELLNGMESTQVSEDLTTTSEIVSSSTSYNKLFTGLDASTGTFKPPVPTEAAVPSASISDGSSDEAAGFCTNPNKALYPRTENLRLELKDEKGQAIKRSREMTCGICLDKIIKREFGILPNCTHSFCFICIDQWRKKKRLFNYTIQCPVCRGLSDFIYPSRYWIKSEIEKDKLIKEYKDSMSKKECPDLKRGLGVCQYGITCHYLHVVPGKNKTE